MSKKHLGVQLSHNGSTSRCWKLQMMFSDLLPSLHPHMVQALLQVLTSAFLPADLPGTTVVCPQVYRGISKLELISMSTTLSGTTYKFVDVVLFVINLVIN